MANVESQESEARYGKATQGIKTVLSLFETPKQPAGKQDHQ